VPPESSAFPDAVVVVYRWRLLPGTEATFTQAWTRVTGLLRARGSLGSRLHRGADGIWYGYAQWPSARAREQAFAAGPVDEAAMAGMRSAVAERFPEIILEPVADYLVPLRHEQA
jgi:hypothetical protein